MTIEDFVIESFAKGGLKVKSVYCEVCQVWAPYRPANAKDILRHYGVEMADGEPAQQPLF